MTFSTTDGLVLFLVNQWDVSKKLQGKAQHFKPLPLLGRFKNNYSYLAPHLELVYINTWLIRGVKSGQEASDLWNMKTLVPFYSCLWNRRFLCLFGMTRLWVICSRKWFESYYIRFDIKHWFQNCNFYFFPTDWNILLRLPQCHTWYCQVFLHNKCFKIMANHWNTAKSSNNMAFKGIRFGKSMNLVLLCQHVCLLKTLEQLSFKQRHRD